MLASSGPVVAAAGKAGSRHRGSGMAPVPARVCQIPRVSRSTEPGRTAEPNRFPGHASSCLTVALTQSAQAADAPIADPPAAGPAAAPVGRQIALVGGQGAERIDGIEIPIEHRQLAALGLQLDQQHRGRMRKAGQLAGRPWKEPPSCCGNEPLNSPRAWVMSNREWRRRGRKIKR